MSANMIDLRSDTVTRPTQAMRKAMAEAVVGDDVLGDDPTVIALQERIATIMGKEAACFVPTGTMANQTAIRAQTEPGDEVIAHADSHIIHYETGSPAALSGVMIRPLAGPAGLFGAADVNDAVRTDTVHSPHSAMLLIENTHNRGGGAVWPLAQVERVAAAGRAHGLKIHLDGARIWNACAATGLEPEKYARNFDTISCCFSKGLGAPAGSAVAGGRATIARVARFRKMFGGTMRQSGVLAAAALHALDHHRERLVEDHAKATRLAEALGNCRGLSIPLRAETNMCFVDIDERIGTASGFCQRLKAGGVLALPTGPRRVRFVCHLDVPAPMIEQAIGVIKSAAA